MSEDYTGFFFFFFASFCCFSKMKEHRPYQDTAYITGQRFFKGQHFYDCLDSYSQVQVYASTTTKALTYP